jgi:hypothetical protein
MSCRRERREIENLNNEKIRLEALVIGFKSNNEEYLKIRQVNNRIDKLEYSSNCCSY